MITRVFLAGLVAVFLAAGCASSQQPAPSGPSAEEIRRAEDAARRAEDAAKRAEVSAEKSEVIFHKGLEK